jgi:hypothetical protein
LCAASISSDGKRILSDYLQDFAASDKETSLKIQTLLTLSRQIQWQPAVMDHERIEQWSVGKRFSGVAYVTGRGLAKTSSGRRSLAGGTYRSINFLTLTGVKLLWKASEKSDSINECQISQSGCIPVYLIATVRRVLRAHLPEIWVEVKNCEVRRLDRLVSSQKGG